MADFRKWLFRVAFLAVLVFVTAAVEAQTPLPSQVFGVFGTTEGNAGAFFGQRLSDSGIYSKTVATFSGSDSGGAHCGLFRPNCSATSSVVTGFEYVFWQSATGRLLASCDGQGGAASSGPNVGFSWGGGCHGWLKVKPGKPFYIGLSPRYTKDNVGPNSGKLAFNLDLLFGK